MKDEITPMYILPHMSIHTHRHTQTHTDTHTLPQLIQHCCVSTAGFAAHENQLDEQQ